MKSIHLFGSQSYIKVPAYILPVTFFLGFLHQDCGFDGVLWRTAGEGEKMENCEFMAQANGNSIFPENGPYCRLSRKTEGQNDHGEPIRVVNSIMPGQVSSRSGTHDDAN